MLKRKYSWTLAASVMAVTPLASTSVFAAGLDGSSDIVCSVIDVTACVEDGACIEGPARSFDLPEFLILDAKKKLIRGADESGHDAVSAVKNMEKSGDHLVLQGVENGRGWDIAIDAKTGKMRGAGVGDAVSFLVFGSCTTL